MRELFHSDSQSRKPKIIIIIIVIKDQPKIDEVQANCEIADPK